MKEIDPSNGFHVYGWMKSELHLNGAELITFAIVHQFTQSGAGIYKGNTGYLCAWTGWTENTARKHLTALVEKGLIQEQRGRANNVPYCYYQLAPDFYEKHPAIFEVSPLKKRRNHPSKNEGTTPQNLRGDYNIGTINIDNTPRFKKPTYDEVRQYCTERGNTVDPEAFISFYESNGWKVGRNPMKDWKAAVRTWEKRRNPSPSSARPLPNKSNYVRDGFALLDKFAKGEPIL